MMRRVDANDAASICVMAGSYYQGLHGLQQDEGRAIKLYAKAAEHAKAAELGCSKAHCILGDIYHEGGVEKGQVPQRGCGYGRT